MRDRQVYTGAIGRAGSDILILNEEIDRMKAILAELRARKEDTVQRRDEYRAFLSVMRRLPYDILYSIFVEYVLQLGGNPWVLMAVCKSWRRFAIEAKPVSVFPYL